MTNTLRTLLDGLRFSVLLPPRDRQLPTGAGAFWCAALLSLLADVALNAWLVEDIEEFAIAGVGGSALQILKPLLLGWVLALMAQRPVLMWALSTWLLLIGSIARVVVSLVLSRAPEFDHSWIMFAEPQLAIASGIWLWLAGCRIWHALEPHWAWYRIVAFATAGALPLMLLLYTLPYQLDYFYGPDEDYEEVAEEEDTWPTDIPIETLFADQAARVDAELEALSPQRPGKIDLYLLSVGGDANEDVFRNEVEYAQALFDQRFGTRGRSITLLNHPDTLEDLPLATDANIDRALAGIGKVIDPEEDIVFLFVTSHGSENHELAIDLMGLPMLQLTPESLSDSIRRAGIHWRVAVISACYSGGYVDALSSSTALVLTAARSDRTSFGCGADADVTYFGRAYLVEALNQTDDFRAAFEIAKDAIALREEADGETPSEPQIASTPLIEAKLAAWREHNEAGPPLPFVAPEYSESEEEASDADAR